MKVLGEWANTLLNGFSKRVENTNTKIAYAIYHELAKGEPATRQAVASRSETSIDDVNKTLADWIGVYYDEKESIIGFWGLTIKPMSHKIVVEGTTLYTWCAWDALFVPDILKKSVQIESKCPATRENITLECSSDSASNIKPESAVLSFVDCSEVDDNIIKNFCHYVHFYKNEESAAKWLAEDNGRFLISISDGIKLGKMRNENLFRSVREYRG